MTSFTPEQTLTYDQAIEVFLATGASYDHGLSNHGPMASEALVHMGADRWIAPFVDAYRPRLDPRTPAPVFDPVGWRVLLRAELPGLAGAAAAEAGHGLLRTAHAVRAIERGEQDGDVPPVRIAELGAALGYWGSGFPGLPAPAALGGRLEPAAWAESLARLSTDDPLPGLLTATLGRAARQERFVETVASLALRADPAETLDELALLAAAGYLRNEEFLSWFALLHGVTVSTMARVLLPHLDATDGGRLVAAVAGFVGAAIVGFDRPARDQRRPPAPGPDQADRAGATLDDHTIKFTDACLGLAERTGSDVPLIAAERQIERTS